MEVSNLPVSLTANQQAGYVVSCNRNTVVETGNDTETGKGFSPFCVMNFFVVLFFSSFSF